MEQAVEANAGEAIDLSLFEQVARFAILAAVLLIPLAINPFGFQPYTIIKVTIFRLLLSVGVLFFLLKAVSKGSLRVNISRPHAYFLGYIAAATLATVFSVSPSVSLTGWFMRYDGLLSLLSYAVLFVICYHLFSDREKVIDFLQILFTASFFICLYGAAEFLGFSIFPELAKDPSRLASLWGNPGYLGGFLALTLPISVAVAVSGEKYPKIKWPALINMSVAFPVLVFSHTRSAWIGVAASLLIIGMKYARRIDYKTAVAAALAVILLVAMITVGGGSSAGSSKKASAATNVNINSQARFFYWRVALTGMLKKPVFGYGPDTFNYIYQQNRPAEWLKFDRERAPVDKAHNDLLQVGSTTGVVGLVSYLALIGVIVYGLAQRVRRDESEDTVLVFAMLAGVVSYLVFMQAYFSISELAPLFWGVAAVAYALNDRDKRALDLKLPASLTRGVVAVAVIALIVAAVILTIRVQAADLRFKRGFDFARVSEWAGVANENRMAVQLDPGELTYKVYLGRSLNNYAAVNRSDEFFNEAIVVYKSAIKSDPNFVDAYVGLGDTYYNQHKVLRKETLDEALRAYRRADEKARYSPQIKSKIALVLANQNNHAGAIEVLEEVAEIDPENPKNFLNLSQAYQEAGSGEKAVSVLKEALKKWPGNAELKERLDRIGG